MRALRVSIILGVSTLSFPVAAQSFLGEWRAAAQAPDGPISETLTVEKSGDSYSITASDAQPPPAEGMKAGPATEIQIDGDNFAFKRIIDAPTGPIEILYKGTVSGDNFTGTGEIMGYSVPYNGVRTKK